MHELLERPSTRVFLEHLHRHAPADVVRMAAHMAHGEERKYVKVRIDPKELPSLELLMITDVQFGHVCCQERRYLEFRDWVLAQPNRFVLLGGDMVDAAHSLSVASPYENQFEPQAQVLRFVEATLPMRHRILGSVGGNHERRAVKMFGDLGRLIATLLRIPYSAGKQYIDISYGEHNPFKISLWHGAGGARTKGAHAQMLHRFMSQGDSTLYLAGHLHSVIVIFDWRECRVGNHIKLEKYAGALSSSFLEYYGTYAEVAGLAPSDTMMARVVLEPNKRWELTLR